MTQGICIRYHRHGALRGSIRLQRTDSFDMEAISFFVHPGKQIFPLGSYHCLLIHPCTRRCDHLAKRQLREALQNGRLLILRAHNDIQL